MPTLNEFVQSILVLVLFGMATWHGLKWADKEPANTKDPMKH